MHNTDIAPQAATAAAAALYVTNGLAAFQPNNHTRSSGLAFNGFHPCKPCNYMDYYSFTDPDGMEG